MKQNIPINLENPNHVFVIAEAGSNWKCGTYDEDLSMAYQLIETAAKCGSDAIKFQTYRASTVYVPEAGKVGYLKSKGNNQDIYNIFEKNSMPYEMLQDLAKKCKDEQIHFMSTPFSVEDAKQVDKYVSIHKVASYEINHVSLLEFLTKTKKPIILSTGANNLDEIDFAVELLKKEKVEQIAILQCTAKYPASLESLNLSVIPELKKRYNIPVGLSDHSTDPIIGPIAAVALGSTIIEKHFTMDKNLPGPDHYFALNPNELKLMIDCIRKAQKVKGNANKKILKEELELRNFAVRSVQATKNIMKGELLLKGNNIDVLRSGNQKRGADARFVLEINKKNAIRNIEKGSGINLEDCK